MGGPLSWAAGALLSCTALAALAATPSSWPGADTETLAADLDPAAIEAGRRMYREGVLPSGERMTGIVQGDIALSGDQVICGWCHRRSGLGASEGQDVVPAVTGDILYEPLRLPTSKPPLAPEQRPAYTDETLKRAIRDGVGPDGEPLDPLMPRYPLVDADLDLLVGYLKTLTTAPDPGVDERDIHFATVVSDGVDPATREAVLDVFQKYVEQKNVETRNESQRAAHAPRHKAWIYEPYRKWVLHTWKLEGPAHSWPAQLQAAYAKQPVFAIVGGLVDGPWRPVHEFCERQEIPCLFPDTDLPVVDEADFYSVYLTRGMALEADAVARHLSDSGLLSAPIVQVSGEDAPRSLAAAERFRDQVHERGGNVTDITVSDGSDLDAEFWAQVAGQAAGGTLVVWLDGDRLAGLWGAGVPDGIGRVYLSTSLFGLETGSMPQVARDKVFLVHPYELPDKLPRLLIRATGWLRAKRIYAPEAEREQANAFFALKMAGAALQTMRGFFVREYLLEKLEHMTENASYTSVYSRLSLAPGQRVISRGAYITRFDANGDLVAVTDWLIPRAH